MSADLSSTNNTVKFQNLACRVSVCSNGLFLQVSCGFCKEFHALRLTEGFGSLQYFNIQGLKYDDPPLPET